MEQVIMNLAVNARDAMPMGGKLIFETANAELDEAYSLQHQPLQPGSYVMLAVTDTGSGMSEETLARIFEPFYTTKEKGRGTGLGLSTVYGIVKQSKGCIWAYSKAGQGTTFKIYLPRVKEKMEATTRGDQDLLRPAGGSETILLAEDDESVRELMRKFLELKGYTVIEVQECAEAIETCKRAENAIHLLITDVVMPRMSGPQLAGSLRKACPEMKVLYTSGYPDDRTFHHSFPGVGTHFLAKPFSLETIVCRVRDVLEPGREDASPQ